MYDALDLKLINEADLVAEEIDLVKCPFFQKIDHVWHSIRGKQQIPNRSDFSIPKLGSELNWIGLLEIGNRKPEDYLIRIQAEGIAEVIGNFTGKTLKDVPPVYMQNCVRIVERVQKSCRPVTTFAEVLHPDKISISVYNWAAPLSMTGTSIDFVVFRPHYVTRKL